MFVDCDEMSHSFRHVDLNNGYIFEENGLFPALQAAIYVMECAKTVLS